MKKYLLCPGYVISNNDGEVHYITEEQLIRLYGVNRNDYVSIKDLKGSTSLISLRPRPSGIYRIPKLKTKEQL